MVERKTRGERRMVERKTRGERRNGDPVHLLLLSLQIHTYTQSKEHLFRTLQVQYNAR